MKSLEKISEFETKEKEPKQEVRIGVVADLHAVDDPNTVIEKLRDKELDYTVIAGDAVGSETINNLVDRIKKGEIDEKNLNEKEKKVYDKIIAEGYHKPRALVRAKFDTSKTLKNEDIEATKEDINQLATAIKDLPNPSFLSGNVEIGLPGRKEIVEKELESQEIPAHFMPSYTEIDKDRGLIFWPSLDFKQKDFTQELENLLEQFTEKTKDKKQLIVITHEHMFRGPRPEVFKERVPETKDQPSIQPFYNINPSWEYLLKLFRSIPEDVAVAMVSGHLHTDKKLIQKGVPYLRDSKGGGLDFRVYGAGKTSEGSKEGNKKERKVKKRIIEMFPVPADKACVLVSDREKGYKMEMY